MDQSLDDGSMSDNAGRSGAVRWRTAAWTTAVLILLLPAVAMPFTDEVNWTAGDFGFAALLLFGALGSYELAARMTGNIMYRAGAGVAVGAALLLIWINAAVGLTDSTADGLYLGVVAVGVIGAVIARFRPKGMAYAMGATALAQAAVGTGALIAGIVPAYTSAPEVLGLTAFFVVLFAGSAGLFGQAARGRSESGTA